MFLSEGRRMALQHHFPLVGPISLEFNDDDIAPLNMSIKAYDKYLGGLKFDAEDAQNLTKVQNSLKLFPFTKCFPFYVNYLL